VACAGAAGAEAFAGAGRAVEEPAGADADEEGCSADAPGAGDAVEEPAGAGRASAVAAEEPAGAGAEEGEDGRLAVEAGDTFAAGRAGVGGASVPIPIRSVFGEPADGTPHSLQVSTAVMIAKNTIVAPSASTSSPPPGVANLRANVT